MCQKFYEFLSITKATFGKTVEEYKKFKEVKNPKQNLRDNMTDWELILTMIGEKATTDITVYKDDKKFHELKQSANDGGAIAKNTRRQIEQKTGKSLISKQNHLHLTEKTSKKIKN